MSDPSNATPEEPPRPTNSGMSVEIGELAMALARAQGAFFAPSRNKSVEIPKKKGGTIEFRYSTLDNIHDMIRGPLADNNLAQVQPIRGNRLYTRLIHASGQWLESVMEVRPEEPGIHALGADITYIRRYALTALLGIAPDEDNDGIAAAGVSVDAQKAIPVDGADADRRASYARLERHSRMVALCNAAQTQRDVTAMFNAWQRDSVQFMSYRDNPAEEEQWRVILELTTDALRRNCGAEIGRIWRMMLTLTDQKSLDDLRAAWVEPEVAETCKRFKVANPGAFNLLGATLQEKARQVEEAHEKLVREPATVIQAPVVPTQESSPAPALPEPVVQQVQHEQPAEANLQHVDDTEFFLRDEVGEILGDPISDPVVFARVYGELLAVSEPAFVEKNAIALEWVRRDFEAAELLRGYEQLAAVANPMQRADASPPAPAPSPDLQAEQAAPAPANDTQPAKLQQPLSTQLFGSSFPMRIPVVTTRNGAADVVGYVRRVTQAVEALAPTDLKPWVEANRFSYNGLPSNTRLKVMSIVSMRAEVLGVDARTLNLTGAGDLTDGA